jgi:hypothetical protein
LIIRKGTAAGALALLLCGSAVAQAPPGRCALVCPPDQRINVEKCGCEAHLPVQQPSCALVCPTPDQTLDAERCRCVSAH